MNSLLKTEKGLSTFFTGVPGNDICHMTVLCEPQKTWNIVMLYLNMTHLKRFLFVCFLFKMQFITE